MVVKVNSKAMERLTGNYHFKKSFFGLILMVEYILIVIDEQGDPSPEKILWRKAKKEDLSHLKI